MYFFAVELFLEFLEACFQFNYSLYVRLTVKERKLWCSKRNIARHHTPTWWVACDFSHVYSLWIPRRGVRLSHGLVFHMSKPEDISLFVILSRQVWWCNVKRLLSSSKNYICKFMQVNWWHHRLFHFHLSFWIWKPWRGMAKIYKNLNISRTKRAF